MSSYTDEQRNEAIALADKHGPAEAARRTGVPRRTISSWRDPAQADAKKTEAARIANTWTDFRASEALAAGSAANRMRRETLEASADKNHQLLRARVIAYGIFIDKAEVLSGQASERIAIWAESEIDRDLRQALDQLEKRIRGGD